MSIVLQYQSPSTFVLTTSSRMHTTAPGQQMTIAVSVTHLHLRVLLQVSR